MKTEFLAALGALDVDQWHYLPTLARQIGMQARDVQSTLQELVDQQRIRVTGTNAAILPLADRDFGFSIDPGTEGALERRCFLVQLNPQLEQRSSERSSEQRSSSTRRALVEQIAQALRRSSIDELNRWELALFALCHAASALADAAVEDDDRLEWLKIAQSRLSEAEKI